MHGQDELLTLIALLPLLPLLGALFNLCFGAALERRGRAHLIHRVAIAAMVGAFGVAVFSTFQLEARAEHDRVLREIFWTMFSVGELRADLGLAFDPLSAVMALVITSIGTLIHVYSTAYMKGVRGYWRYFFALNLFVSSMLLLVLADNLVLLFFGWEGVGVCSYLLIGFFYEDRVKARAALKAFVVNRVGDAAFIVGLLLLFWALGGVWREAPAALATDPSGLRYERIQGEDERRRPTLRFDLLREQIALLDVGAREDLERRSWHGVPLLVLIGGLLFLGATAKSAQLPLYVWLPDAMAGPTPVSALIHAATMVTAGVYLLARLSFLFALSPVVVTIIAWTGAATALLGALIAIVQTDLKRVLAYSTVSQLGLMFVGAASGAYAAAIFHLVAHGFFKACLFLGAGSVIHALHHEQDMRRMGGLGRAMPITRATYLYACVAISGLPLASGFFSKDELLVGALTARTNLLPGVGPALWAGGLVVALLTSFYMWRSYFLTFSGAYRGGPRPPSESPRAITWVLVALALGTAGVTFLGFWPPLGELLGSDALTHPWLERWLEPSLAPVPEWVRARAAPPSLEAQLVTAVTSVVMALGGWGAAFAFYRNRSQLPEPFARRLRPLRALVQTRFYVDELYGALIVTPTRLLARGFAWVDSVLIDGLVHLVARWTRTLAQADEVFDRVVVDGLVNGLARTLSAAGGRLQRLQTGRLQTYLYAAVAGAVLVLGLNLLLRR